MNQNFISCMKLLLFIAFLCLFSRQNLNIQAFLCISYIKFLLFIIFFLFFLFSNKISILFSMHQFHKVSFIYCFCFYFFQTKFQYSFLRITYIRLLFIHQLRKVCFIHYFCFIRQNLKIYSTYKWEESNI